MSYWSPGDEAAFFAWIQAITGVTGVRGVGRELHISLRSKRLSSNALREFIALYKRYGGDFRELAPFLNAGNSHWFANPNAHWHKAVFGSHAQ